jgi:type VI secretion system protein VasD
MVMILRQLLGLGLVFLLTGCGAGVSLPIPLEPTRVLLEIEADGDINPSVSGRPSPVVLRIYELVSSAGFEEVDFFSVYEKKLTALGANLLGEQEVILKPYDKKTVLIEPSLATRSLGFFVAYRDYEQAKWRAVAGVVPNTFTTLYVKLFGTSITIR